MKEKTMMMRVVATALFLVFLIGFTQARPVYAAEQTEQEEIQAFLEGYFPELYDTMKSDSEKDYSSTDFISVRGYIVAKLMVDKRQFYNEMYGGIIRVKIKEVTLEELSQTGDRIEVFANVSYKYRIAEDSQPCHGSVLYRVTLSKKEDGYQVLDLDDNDVRTMNAKIEIWSGSKSIEEIESDFYDPYDGTVSDEHKEMDCAKADEYMELLKQNMESLQNITFAEEKEEDADDSSEKEAVFQGVNHGDTFDCGGSSIFGWSRNKPFFGTCFFDHGWDTGRCVVQ